MQQQPLMAYWLLHPTVESYAVKPLTEVACLLWAASFPQPSGASQTTGANQATAETSRCAVKLADSTTRIAPNLALFLNVSLLVTACLEAALSC